MRNSSVRPRTLATSSRLDLASAGLRVLAGRSLRWRHRLASIATVASDMDADAGVATVWFARHPRRRSGDEAVCQYERVSGSWRYVGGSGGGGTGFAPTSRPTAAVNGQASMLTSMSGAAWRSWADREAAAGPFDFARVGWAACAMFRAAAEVKHLLVGARRIDVPEHGYVVVAWRAPPSAESPPTPPIAALDGDGAVLTELRPGEHLDTLSWAAIEEALAEG